MKRLFLASLVSATLIGCGGSSSSENKPQESIWEQTSFAFDDLDKVFMSDDNNEIVKAVQDMHGNIHLFLDEQNGSINTINFYGVASYDSEHQDYVYYTFDSEGALYYVGEAIWYRDQHNNYKVEVGGWTYEFDKKDARKVDYLESGKEYRSGHVIIKSENGSMNYVANEDYFLATVDNQSGNINMSATLTNFTNGCVFDYSWSSKGDYTTTTIGQDHNNCGRAYYGEGRQLELFGGNNLLDFTYKQSMNQYVINNFSVHRGTNRQETMKFVDFMAK